MVWKSTGDDQIRKYDFSYDNSNRLANAIFKQYGSSTNAFDLSDKIDFSVKGLSYDANGNILFMNQSGWKVGGSVTIDSLQYTYNSNTNKLLNVIDRVNDTATRLGDFRSSKTYMTALGNNKTTGATDYTYDGNGNLKKDLNKDIGTSSASGITYNHLNLPDSITVAGKGTIKYVYDALGNKLKKITTEGSKVTTTLYLFGNYVNDTLQYLPQEEGRIRYNPDSARFENDYFIKDHLGNVRLVLTDANQRNPYHACTMEKVDSTDNNLYYSNVSATRDTVPPGYPLDNSYSNPNSFVCKVNGSGNKIGSAIIVKVMVGDKMNIRTSDWYNLNGNTPATPYNPVTDLITALTNSIGAVVGGKATVTELTSASAINPGALSYYTSHNTADSISKPKAFLNWILFDEQFNYVSSSSGFLQVGGSNLGSVTPLQQDNIAISKNGYFYVYVSNETPNINVFFDNLQVTHIRGPLLEESHYYPFGLTISGISSGAVAFGQPDNKRKYNGIELDKDLNVNTYEAQFRDLDPQTARWWQIDPKIEQGMENCSPYLSMYDDPVRQSDPLGDKPEDDYKIYRDGKIERSVTNDKFDRFYLVEQFQPIKKGTDVDNATVSTYVGEFSKNENGLIQIPSSLSGSAWGGSFGFSVKEGNSTRAFARGDAMAALIGSVADAHVTDLTINGFSLPNGQSPSPSKSHKNGVNGDLRYLRTDKSGGALTLGNSKLDFDRQSSLNNSLFKFGWKDMISERFTMGSKRSTLLPHTSSAKERGISSDHSTHLHLQGFKPNVKTDYVVY